MKIIDINEKEYPKVLRKIENPPKKLYVEGDEKILNSNCIAVVGSRKNTKYGEKWCKKFVKELVKYDLKIVSGISIGCLVVEAAYRSGTSVTAKFAKDQKRDVFCIPGSLDNSKSIGTNKLIKDFAKLVTSPEDIIKNYEFLHKIELEKPEEKEEENEILKLIKEDPINIDDIVKLSNKNIKEIISEITILELDGKIERLPGNMYIRGE